MSKNPTVRLEQTNLAREILAAKDSDAFGNECPSKSDPNCSIVTFQNNGQMDRYTLQAKFQQIEESLKESDASVAMYTKHCLHKIGKQTE